MYEIHYTCAFTLYFRLGIGITKTPRHVLLLLRSYYDLIEQIIEPIYLKLTTINWQLTNGRH